MEAGVSDDQDYRKEVRRLYDSISEEFNRTRIKPDPLLEMLVKRGFSRGAKLILDNGCGNCRNLWVFVDNTVVAGDFSRNMLKQCMRKNFREVHYVQYELTHLPFRNNVFSSIICISTIHHLKENEAEEALMEMRRILSKRGWMLVSSWSIKMIRNKKLLRKTRRVDEKYFLVNWGSSKRFYFLMNAETLRSMCKKAGFPDAIILEYGMNNYGLVDRRL